MSKQTKILVIKSKELIYTMVFLIVGILIIYFLFHILSSNVSDKTPSNSSSCATNTNSIETLYITNSDKVESTFYFAGIPLNLLITLDESQITSVEITNLDDNTKSMYPLLEPSLENINNQLNNNIPLENISYSKDNEYTSIILLDSIKNALSTSKE